MLRPGGGIVYYSPRERIRDGALSKSCTTISTVRAGEPWQDGDENADFRPWRRAVDYRTDVRDALIDELRGILELTESPNRESSCAAV